LRITLLLHSLPYVLTLCIFYTSSPLLIFLFLSFLCSVAPRALHSFPTRRSSDLLRLLVIGFVLAAGLAGASVMLAEHVDASFHRDRKSTRLNSSHQIISYAVFCLKKKKKKNK